MIRARFVVSLGMLAATVPASAEQPDFPSEPIVRVEQDGGVTRVDAIVPGHIVAFAHLRFECCL